MSKFEIALLLVGIYHMGFALMQHTNRVGAALLYKVLPFFFGLFEILLSLRYAGIIGGG